jgi:hypothetical protein
MMELSITYLLYLLLPLQFSCNTIQQGCTDPLASNFDPTAIDDDSSCIYDTIYVSPDWTIELSEKINETSGLILWDGDLWTMNDDADTRLYRLDTATGDITGEYTLPGVVNQDWEDLAQDEDYIYVGDIGNNLGNRRNLHILRIEKLSLTSGDPSIDTIWFSFSDQHNFEPSGANQTEFDCEAMVVSSDSIYLFTKQWLTGFTTRYSMPKLPGNFVAQKRDDFDTKGQVTGACFLEQEKVLALCGYTGLTIPFLYLFYDYPGDDFFAGKRKRVNIPLPFHQVEGVTTVDGVRYYLSNEGNSLPVGGVIPQKLIFLDLRE